MLLQILQRTPPWVFALFAVLVVFGLLQTRTRQVSLARVSILPLVLIGLSLSGIVGTFGANAYALAAWFAAVLTAVLLNRAVQWPRTVSYTAATRRFLVAGSWAPLAVMMAIFFTRYAVSVTLAMHPELAATAWLPIAVSFAYGLMSGAFLARALRILGGESVSVELTLPGAIHLAAVVPAVVIGVAQFAARKGTRPHKVLGWIWVLSMAVVAVSSFWILELRKGAGFSVIHLLSLWVLICLVCAVWFIRRGNVRAHKGFMLGVTLGLVGAGIGALMPGRFLAQLFS